MDLDGGKKSPAVQKSILPERTDYSISTEISGSMADETTALLRSASQEEKVGAAYGSADEPTETENPNRPKGIKFVILFLCILLGVFYVGYLSFEQLSMF